MSSERVDNDFNNYAELGGEEEDHTSDETPYDQKGIEYAVFDEFKTRKDEEKKIVKTQLKDVEEEWENFRKSGKLYPNLSFVDEKDGH